MLNGVACVTKTNVIHTTRLNSKTKRKRREDKYLTLVPAAVFWRRLPAAGGYFTPPGISRVLEHIATKFQRLSPCFPGQTF